LCRSFLCSLPRPPAIRQPLPTVTAIDQFKHECFIKNTAQLSKQCDSPKSVRWLFISAFMGFRTKSVVVWNTAESTTSLVHSYHIPRAQLPHPSCTVITSLVHSYNIPRAQLSHPSRTVTTSLVHSYHIPRAQLSHPSCTVTTSLAHSYHIPRAQLSHPSRTVMTSLVHSYHIPRAQLSHPSCTVTTSLVHSYQQF
jgi:hypothetical protein